MNLKKFASLMVLVVLIFGLVACNQDGAKENEKPAEEPANVEKAEESTEEPDETDSIQLIKATIKRIVLD